MSAICFDPRFEGSESLLNVDSVTDGGDPMHERGLRTLVGTIGNDRGIRARWGHGPALALLASVRCLFFRKAKDATVCTMFP